MATLNTCQYIYDPTTTPRDQSKFVVHFDNQENKDRQLQRATKVIDYLQVAINATLEDESARFFKWLVLHPLSPCNMHYAHHLLAFFHSRGLLVGKKTVDNPVKQLKHRYLVVFSMGKHVFAKHYNSIRELKADTGKRPSQIQRRKTSLVCQKLS